MARAIWKGHMVFGLVSIPVGLYSAVETSEEVHFRLLHRKDKAPIRYKKFCSKEDVEVPQDEIVRGYEVSKGKYALVEKEELQEVQEELGEGEHTIELLQFVDACSIDPLLFERPYRLGVEKGGDKAYVVLREALRESNRVGIARLYLRTKPALAALIPGASLLSLAMMRPPESLRESKELAPGRVTARPNERKMARALIDDMVGEFEPAAHPNTYRKAVQKLIAKKARFTLADIEEAAEGEKAPKVVDLMDALKRSLAQDKRGGRKGSKRRAA